MGVLKESSDLAFIFPGQGSQKVGMGRTLYEEYPEAREVFALAQKALDFDLTAACFAGPEEYLQQTEVAQPAILTVSAAAWRVLARRGWRPRLVAGHSLGEYSALVAAEALEITEAVRLVRLRGRLMAEASRLEKGGMAAVLGLREEEVLALCAEAAQEGMVQAANFNCPGQVVLSGTLTGLAAAERLARERGARRFVVLSVSGPFHSSLMRRAAEGLAAALQDVPLRDPQVPLVSNAGGRILRSAEEIKASLIGQMTSPVHWQRCVERMVEAGIRTMVEVGPGEVLAGLVRRISREVEVFPAGEAAEVRKVLDFLEGGR